jgi:hypothetical protein
MTPLPRLSGFTFLSYTRNLQGNGFGDGTGAAYGSDGEGGMDDPRFSGGSPSKTVAVPFKPSHWFESSLLVSFETDPFERAVANALIRMER